MLRKIATAVAALACLVGPSLVISGPLLAHMQERTRERLTPKIAALPQYLPWTPGRAVHVNQSNYGRRTHLNDSNAHSWDFGLPLGSDVVAGIAGVVESTGDDCDVLDSRGCNNGYGNFVKLRVADETCASFLHLSEVFVGEGDAVAVGEIVGRSGSSGNSSGPHLHYEREDCRTGRSFETTFYEAGKPIEGQTVVSAVPQPG